MEEKTNKIGDQIKCSICKTNKLKGGMTFFTCCSIKVSKLVCVKCKDKINCKDCKRKKATEIVKYEDLGKFIIPKPQMKIKKQKKLVNKNQILQECVMCSRKFKQFKIQKYVHKNGCGQAYCYPCLYVLYQSQNQMFTQINIQQKKQYKLVMNCCDQYGQSIDKIQKCFSQEICVFCGISKDIKITMKKTMIKIKNKLNFCRSCFFQTQQYEQITESLTMVIGQILDNYSNQCYFCDKQLNLDVTMNTTTIKAMNSDLCLQCFNKQSIIRQQNPNYLKNFKSKSLSDSGTGLRQCCVQCKQVMIKKRGSNAQFDLFEWKDRKIYCNICLYFKFKIIRSNYFTKIKDNRMINRFQQEFICYQNQFKQLCMICGIKIIRKDINFCRLKKKLKDVTQQQNQNKQLKFNQYQQFQLECIFCFTCLQTLSTQTSKYKKLLQMKQQMAKRDDNFEMFLKMYKQSLNNKKIKEEFKNKYVFHGIKKVQQSHQHQIQINLHTNKIPSNIQPPLFGFRQFQGQKKQILQQQPQNPIPNNKFLTGGIHGTFQSIKQKIPFLKIQTSPKFKKQTQYKQTNKITQKQNSDDVQNLSEYGSPCYKSQTSQMEQLNVQTGNLCKDQQNQIQIQNNYSKKQSTLTTTQEQYQKFIQSIKSLYTQNSSYMNRINDTKPLQLKSPYQYQIDTQTQNKQKPSTPKVIYPTVKKPCQIKGCGHKLVPEDQLMMGIMCKKCWIDYLLGGIDLTQQCMDFKKFKEQRDRQQQEVNNFNKFIKQNHKN